MDTVTDPSELIGCRVLFRRSAHFPTGEHKVLAAQIGDMVARRDARATDTGFAEQAIEASGGGDEPQPRAVAQRAPVDS
jgi:hypothetical protein